MMPKHGAFKGRAFMAAAVVWAIAFIPGSAWTLGQSDVVGVGARAPGMGNAFVAVADSPAASFYNPAGLAQIEGSGIEMGYAYMNSNVDASGFSLDNEGVHLPQLGLFTDFRQIFKMKRRAVLCIYLSFPDKWKSAYRVRTGEVYDPYDPLYGADNHLQRQIFQTASVGFEVLPWLYVGGGINYIVGASAADVRVRTDLYGHIDERVSSANLDVQTDIGYLAGALLKPTDRLRLGFAWRSEIALKIMQGLAADAVASLEGGLITLPIRLGIPIQDAYRPEAYAFGASYYLTDRLLFAFDVTQYRFSDYETPDGVLPLNRLKDIWVPRFGLEWEAKKDLFLRGGYSFMETPVKQQPQGFYKNLVDADKHIFTLGVGYNLENKFTARPLELNAFWQFHYLASKSFEDVHGSGKTWEVHGNNVLFGFSLTLKL